MPGVFGKMLLMSEQLISSAGESSIDARSWALLEQIQQGIIIFEPLRRTSQAITEFQAMVRRLIELERAGLIGHCVVQEHEIAGQKYCDLLMIYTGISERGRELLKGRTGSTG